ncbi:MAG: LysM peptidoglycan-binding domain-containing protein [Pseudomonadota bacterium]
MRARLAQAPTRAIHTVRLGDSLLTLALRYYGDASKTEFILEANRRNLSEDGGLIIGQLLRIPEIEEL